MRLLLGKDAFVGFIDSLRQQYDLDIKYSINLGIALGVDVSMYDNNHLVRGIIEYLQSYFPPVDGFCEIEHYCYFQNFGRVESRDGVVVESPDELYDRLVVSGGLFSSQG